MRDLPTGTVTFVFTDIEGSTALLDELGSDAYAVVLLEHRAALRDAFGSHGGAEVDMQGDAFCYAFARAADAVAAAGEGQELLAGGRIRVRMGVHTGEPIRIDEGYVGIDVHRAARIMAAGHGGQVLVSQSTRDLVPEAELRDLGEHRLKDLTRAERIWQLGEREFPPLESLDRSNLPRPPTPLVGRDCELAEIVDLVRGGARLVTLTGPGGSGKTRLALGAGASLMDAFADGVWFVSLAPVSDPELIVPTIARVVEARGELGSHLRSRRMLLVLDNLEQLLPAGALPIASLEAPALATSRERLNVSSEHEYPVSTLPLDDAVTLFVQSARTVKPGFDADESVTAIARRLDGLPLALELAAARVKVLQPRQLLDRLEHSLDLLTGGSRDLPERQQTLRGTIAWSFDLLAPNEKVLFGRLAVFAGSFDLDAAEHVAGADLDALQSLVDKSLLRQTAEGRFFLLETIREFAVGVLAGDSHADSIRTTHADWYSALMDRLASELADDATEGSLRGIDAELPNVRAALGRLADDDPAAGLSLVSALWQYWQIRGLLDEGMRRVRACWTDDLPSDVRLTTLRLIGAAALWSSDVETLRESSHERLELARAAGSEAHEGGALNGLGVAAQLEGDYRAARELLEQALAIHRRANDSGRRAVTTANLGIVERLDGHVDRSRELLGEALAVFRSNGPVASLAEALCNYADTLVAQSEIDGASAAVRESLQLSDEIGHRGWLPQVLVVAASVAVARGRPLEAAPLLGAAKELEAGIGAAILTPEQGSVYVPTVELAKGMLGGDEFADAFERGRSLPAEDALRLALTALD